MRLAVVSVVAGSLLFAGHASAWNLRGHMMVAAAAWDQLTPQAKARASQLLKLNPDYKKWIKGVPAGARDKTAFTRAAGWPDDIKGKRDYTNDKNISSLVATRNTGYSDKLQHRYWHFVDVPFSTDGTPVVQPAKPNAETQIAAFRDTLAGTAPDALKSYDLVWVIHLVGDVHQPLHATQRFAHDTPKGDKGGNDVAICAVSKCNGNLHAFWDDVLGTSKSPRPAITAAAALSPAPAAAAGNKDVHAWIEESFDLAKASAYKAPIGPGKGPFKLTAAYKSDAKSIASERVALGAARLAKLLNENLK